MINFHQKQDLDWMAVSLIQWDSVLRCQVGNTNQEFKIVFGIHM